MPDAGPAPDPGGGEGTGFHNIDQLPLGSLLHIKQSPGKARPLRKRTLKQLIEKGFK